MSRDDHVSVVQAKRAGLVNAACFVTTDISACSDRSAAGLLECREPKVMRNQSTIDPKHSSRNWNHTDLCALGTWSKSLTPPLFDS